MSEFLHGKKNFTQRLLKDRVIETNKTKMANMFNGFFFLQILEWNWQIQYHIMQFLITNFL